jgi:hypothetical protein
MSCTLSFSCQQAIPQPAENEDAPARKKKLFTAYAALLIALPLLSLFFLYLEHLTHIVFMAHVAAIPLEIMFGAIIVERFLASREKKSRLRQLMHMKSYIFRSRIREVFINNFNALVTPQIDIRKLATADLPELIKLREGLDVLTYRSIDDLEKIAVSYIDARSVFVTFMDWARQHDFEAILEDMIFVLHFIQNVRMYKDYHPDKLFVEYAMSTPQGCEKLRKILTDAVTKFLDYAIELKTERPLVYDELISEYLMASEMQQSQQHMA